MIDTPTQPKTISFDAALGVRHDATVAEIRHRAKSEAEEMERRRKIRGLGERGRARRRADV